MQNNPFLQMAQKSNPLDAYIKPPEKRIRETLGMPEPDKRPLQEKLTEQRENVTGKKSLAEYSAERPGTFVYEVNRVRNALKIKPGSDKDKALKGILADRAADGSITQEEYANVVKMMTDGSFAREYQNLKRRNARAHKLGELPFDESDYIKALSQRLTTFESNGKQYDFLSADKEYAKLGIQPPSAKPETQERQDLRNRGEMPKFDYVEKLDENINKGLDAGESFVAAGLKSQNPFLFAVANKATGTDTAKATAGFLRDVAEDSVIDYGTFLDADAAPVDRLKAGFWVALDLIPAFGDAILKPILKGAKLTAKELGAIKTAGKDFERAIAALPAPQAKQVTEALEFISKASDTDLAKAIDELAQAPEVQRGLPQNTPGIPKATTTSMREPEIPLGDVQRSANTSEIPNSSVDNIADSAKVEPDIPVQDATPQPVQANTQDAGVASAPEEYVPGTLKQPSSRVSKYPEPIETIVDGNIYREVSPAAYESSAWGYPGTHWSNTPDLAKGQRGNTGILIEFSPKPGTPVKVNRSKPGWQVAHDNGATELIIGNGPIDRLPGDIVSVTIKKSAWKELSLARKLQLQDNVERRGWTRTKLPDGSVKYAPPKKNIASPPEVPTKPQPDNIADSAKVKPDIPTQVDAGTPNKVDNVNTGVLSDAVERAKARKAERAAKRAQREAEGIVEAKSGFSDEDFLDLVDDVIIAFGEVVNWTEANVRAFLKERGAEDRFDEVKRLAEQDLADPESLGKAQADTAAIRQERGLPEYQRTPRTLDEVAQNAENVDVQKTVKDILDNPRPMTDAEEYATLQAVDANDRAYRDLTNQYNQAVESGDMATANTIADELERIDAQMVELAEAADKAGTEWGRAGRARQLETLRSREPSVIRYRQYKANGGSPSTADKQRIDDLLEQLEAQKKATADAEARAKAKRAPRVQDKVTAERPPKKVDELIQKNQSDLDEWRKRWAKATPVNKRGGSQSISLAIEGAYYITKGEFLKGVKKLDDLIAAVRKEGLTADDISDDDIISQVEKVLADTKPNRRPPKGPTVKSLRDEIAKRTGRVRETKKAPRTPKTGNTPAAKAERAYRTTVDSLQKELEKLQAATSLLRAADPTGVEFLKLEDDIRKLSAKINRGRAYGKDTLQVGTTGFQGDEVTNLRESLDKLRRDFGFDEQSVNAPGPSYENVIKNIEDIEADKTLSPKQKQDALREQYRILNQGRAEGEGFFMDGKSAIEDPVIAQARAREDAVMANINKELSKQKRKADREAASAGKRLWEDFKSVMGGVKTLMLSGEAGFMGRQAWMPIMTRPRVMINAIKDMKHSVKQEMFDWTVAELKQNPWYEAGQKAGLAITDPSTRVREEDFMTSIFEQMTDSGKVGVKQAGQALDAYSGLNERVYSSFLNRVRMDLFQEFVESAGRKGVVTEKDMEAFANIVNDMTGRSNVPPSAEATVSVINNLLISSRYYYSRLKLLTGANLWSGGSTAAKQRMAIEYARFLGAFATLNFAIQYGSERFGWGVQTSGDPRATNFGKIVFPNGVSLEMDAGMRPFANYGYRMLVTGFNNLQGRTGDNRIPNYVTSAGKEVRDTEASYAKPEGLAASFLAIRSNPLIAFLLKDLSDGESFGNKTDIYKEAATSTVPIIAKNSYERWYKKEDASMQAVALLLEFIGLGGDANRASRSQGISEEQLRELGAID